MLLLQDAFCCIRYPDGMGHNTMAKSRNKGPFDIPAAAVKASIATFTNGGMGTVRTLFPLPTRSTNTHRAPRVRSGAERRPKAPPESRVPFGGLDLGLSEQLACLFPAKPSEQGQGCKRFHDSF
jgi:hypothetical protein